MIMNHDEAIKLRLRPFFFIIPQKNFNRQDMMGFFPPTETDRSRAGGGSEIQTSSRCGV